MRKTIAILVTLTAVCSTARATDTLEGRAAALASHVDLASGAGYNSGLQGYDISKFLYRHFL